MILRGLAGFFAVMVVCGAGELPAHILALAREEHAIADELRHLPDYTCTETIDRFTAEPGRSLKAQDRIVVEIAVANGHELYARPGQNFEERSVVEMVGQGFISDGYFSTMLHNVFVGNSAHITYVGAESAGGRRLLHYDFHIPVMSSGWHMTSRGRMCTMGSLGSFWLDADSLDLVRMRYDAEDLPVWSTDQSLEEDVEYAPVVVGDSRLLLPSSARITAIDFSSRKLQNRIGFTNCRKYSSESSISFYSSESNVTFELPAGTLAARLEKPLDTAHAAVGDEVTASIPGGTLKGAIRSIGRGRVAIEWTRAEYPDRTATVTAEPTYIPIPGRRAAIPAGFPMTVRIVETKTH